MRRHVSLGRVIGASLGFSLVTCALAQTPDVSLDEIIVTGSRLQTDSTDTVAPVTVLTRSDLERAGAASLGGILQALPMDTGSSINTNVDAAVGATRIDLRGLGAERTLVLLNGRRLPNGGIGGDDSVDIDSLPVALIERVEVLASGASAVYGSDAVGGVVNVITKQVERGSDVAASWQVTGEGDGQTASANAATGFGVLGGTWSVGLNYVRQDGVAAAQRDYSAEPLRIIDGNGTLGYAGQNGIPDGQFQIPAGNALGLPPGRYARIAGATGQTAANYRPFVREDSYSVAPFNQSQTPAEHSSVWLLGSNPIGASAHFFFEGLFDRRESSQGAASEQYFPLSDPTPTLADGTQGIPADNYYNPFGVDLHFAARRFVERGPRRAAESIDLWRAVAGVQGGVGAWNWEVAVGTARSSSTNPSTGLFATSRYVDALGPSGLDDSGRIVCGQRDPATGRVPPANVIPGCVPLDIFDGAGSVTQEQLDYMSPRAIEDSGSNEQRFAEAVFKGRAGRVLDRDVHWAFGAEYRRDAGSLVGDPLDVLNFQGLIDPNLPGGAFDVRELFSEVEVPLLHDRPWARDTSLNFGVRWSDYSSSGSNFSWGAGLRWRFSAEFALRANYATVFRAPSLDDLYSSRSIDDGFAFDPCGNDPTVAEQVHCAANGVPGGAYVQGTDQFGVISGGNPALKPESGGSFGFGLVFTPGWARGLTASADAYDIKLTDVVGTQDVEGVLSDCAAQGSHTSCGAIRRNPDGSVSLVSTVNQNLGHREVAGIDLAVDWHAPTATGDFSARILATWLDRWDERPVPGGELFRQAGRFDGGALPRWRASGYLDWRHGPWLASYAAEYVGSMSEKVEEFPPLRIFFTSYRRQIASALFHDLTGEYDFPSGLTLRAAITNLTDESPPFVNTGLPENTDPGTYRLLGRTYFLEARYHF